MSYRRAIALCTTVLILAVAPRGEAFQPHVIDARGDAARTTDVVYALFETFDHPADGPTLQITLGLQEMPASDESATYSVAFNYGDCGGGRVAYDWNGGGPLSGKTLGLAGTVTKASFWTCHPTVNAEGESVYAYTSRDISVTWLDDALQFWVPLSAANLTYGMSLTRTRACTGQTAFGATTDLRRRTGIDCAADISPFGRDYVVGA